MDVTFHHCLKFENYKYTQYTQSKKTKDNSFVANIISFQMAAIPCHFSVKITLNTTGANKELTRL